jgi:tetratricopeptide (TPR) repeat protein
VGDALVNVKKGEAILAGLVARYPQDTGLRHDYSRAANLLVRTYQANGEFANARAAAGKTLAFDEAALRAEPGDVRNLVNVAASLSAVADLATDEKRYDEATPLRERVKQLSAQVHRLRPGDAEATRSLAIAQKKLGALYGVTKRYSDAQREYREAAAIDEQRVAAAPESTRAKLDLSYDYSDLGWVAARLRQYDEALALYRRVLALRTEVAQIDPKDTRARDGLVSAVAKLGSTLFNAGDFAAAIEQEERAIAMYEAIAKSGTQDWSLVYAMAMVHDELADALQTQCAKNHGGAACDGRAAGAVASEVALLEGLQKRGMLRPSDLPDLTAAKARLEKLRHAAQ